MTEDERLDAAMAKRSPGSVIAAARRLASRTYKSRPNWAMAMELYGVGSTFGHMICYRAGIDPDATE